MFALELVGESDALPALEAESAATGVEVVAPGVATADAVALDRVASLALVRAASRLVARSDADVGAAAAALRAAPAGRFPPWGDRAGADAGGPADDRGTVAVRARDVRGGAAVDTQRAERELGAVLVERGYAVDLEAPDHELRALFSADTCLLGWTAAESDRGFAERAPTDRPFFQPGSMDPMLARALVNVALADATSGAPAGSEGGRRRDEARPTLLDPMCGTGGVLVEAGLVGARPLGADAQRKMVRGTRRNLDAALAGGWEVLRADATRLPLADAAVEAAVFDVPYERQSAVAGDSLAALVAGALAETRRVAPRAVVVADRDWSEAARGAGWTVAARVERRMHRSLVRHCHVLDDRAE